MSKNWKTTVAGVVILGGLAYKFYLDPSQVGFPELIGLLTAAGFFASADHNVDDKKTDAPEK